MFGLGMPEILLILAIALIVIGPKKLPDLAKTLGRAMGEFKRSAQDFKRSIDIETTVKDIDPQPKENLKEVIKDINTDSEPESKNPSSGKPNTSPETDRATPQSSEASNQTRATDAETSNPDAGFSSDNGSATPK